MEQKLDPLLFQARMAYLGHRDPQDHRDPLDHRGPLDHWGSLGPGVRQENRDLRDLLGIKASKGKKDREGLTEQEDFREPRGK